ncbi:MAG: CpsD/CapB family tyrosine-protein kinase [Pseudomonadota bacterium]
MIENAAPPDQDHELEQPETIGADRTAAAAVAKALTGGVDREQREAAEAEAAARDADPGLWEKLEWGRLNPRRLARERIVSLDRRQPGHVAVDMIRTRLRPLLEENGWKKVGITSPTPGCGKTFMSANLAFSLVRGLESRAALFDLDMKSPSVAKSFGHRKHKSMVDFLTGQVAPEDFLLRFDEKLAVGLNTEKSVASAEILSTPRAREIIDRSVDDLGVEAAIIDLPPLLSTDDALAALPMLDCVMLVISSGHTKRKEVQQCERLLQDQVNFLGCVINKCEERLFERYYY